MGFRRQVKHFDTAATVDLALTEFSAADPPKQIILLTMNSTALGTGLDPTMCLGWEDYLGNRFSASQAYKDNVTNQAYASGHRDTTTYGAEWGYLSGQTTQTVVARMTVTSWQPDNLRLTFSSAPGTPVKCAALILGGSDFTPGAPVTKTQNGVTGNQTLSDWSFQPTGAFVINGSIAATGQTAHSWIGLIDSDGNQMATWALSNGFGNGVRRRQFTDAFYVQSWAGTPYSKISFLNWTANGMQVNHGLSYNTARWTVIPFRIEPGAGKCELDMSAFNSTDLQTQAVSSGYTPRALFAAGYCGAASGSDLTDGCALGVGFSDFTTHACGTFFVNGTYPANSRAGLHFDSDSVYAGFGTYNTEVHQLVPSTVGLGYYKIYPALQAAQQVGMLAFLEKRKRRGGSWRGPMGLYGRVAA